MKAALELGYTSALIILKPRPRRRLVLHICAVPQICASAMYNGEAVMTPFFFIIIACDLAWVSLVGMKAALRSWKTLTVSCQHAQQVVEARRATPKLIC